MGDCTSRRQNATNREGLTFEEWVCAAGVAVIDDGSVGVRPYTTSYFGGYSDFGRNRVLIDGHILPCFVPVRRKVVWYAKKVRQAWKSGEDPTEWRP